MDFQLHVSSLSCNVSAFELYCRLIVINSHIAFILRKSGQKLIADGPRRIVD